MLLTILSWIRTCNNRSKKNYLLFERNYHTINFFKENPFTIEMRKTQILMNKPIYLGSSI